MWSRTAFYNPPMRHAALFALLAIAAGARLLLQIAAMPPYAGLDEPYHVARLAFVREEHRNPTIAEPSVPPYVANSMRGNGAMPAFASMRDRWPAVVASRNRRIVVDRPFTASDLRPFVAWNYEAQQPSLYYTAAAPLGGGSAVRSFGGGAWPPRLSRWQSSSQPLQSRSAGSEPAAFSRRR